MLGAGDTVVQVQPKLKRGVAQSLSGARYEHYKVLPEETVKRMVHKILNGEPPEGPRSVLTACRGLALDKGGRKVRPVAIGEAIRRIAARVVCAQDGKTISLILEAVNQFGVGVKGGIEYAYHSVRVHMMATYDEYEHQARGQHKPDPNKIPALMKVDFKNGYNSTCRAKMLAQVRAKTPTLLRFATFLYVSKRTLA